MEARATGKPDCQSHRTRPAAHSEHTNINSSLVREREREREKKNNTKILKEKIISAFLRNSANKQTITPTKT